MAEHLLDHEVGGRTVRRALQPAGRDPVLPLRYYGTFGPNQSLYPIRKIIPMFAALAMRGRPLEVFGDGDQVVDLVYSPDLAHLTVQFLAEEYTDAVVESGRSVGLRSTRWPSR